MSVENIITQLAAIEATIEGITRAYDKSPEGAPSTADLPAVINFPSEGEFNPYLANGVLRATHRIKTQLFVSTRTDLPSDETACRPFIERFPNKLYAEMYLNNSCGSSRLLSYRYGILEYGGTSYLGIEFIIEAKEDTVVPFSGGE